jgi:adenosylcobinamide-GDP ribazoletransferase
MRSLAVAVQLLTRIPIRLPAAPSAAERARAVAWFPVVGAGVGALAAGAHALVAQTRAPALAPWAALATALLLTGGFHEDGLADSADGIFGGHDRARRLAIMRDSRLGSYGVLALIVTLGVQVSALGSLPAATAAYALVAAHALGRAAALPLLRLPYAREDSDGVGRFAEPPQAATLALGVGAGALGVALLPYRAALGCLGVAALITLGCARLYARELGGITGDALGATVKLVEVGCYVTTAVLA